MTIDLASLQSRDGARRVFDAPGYKLQKNERENNSSKMRNQKYPIQWEKTKENRNKNRKASETIIDINGLER